MENLTLDNEKKAAIDDMLVRIFTTNVSTRRRELTFDVIKKCNTNVDYSDFEHLLDNVKRENILKIINGLNYELGGLIDQYYDRVRNQIF
jgi:hypothetical protein